MIIDKKKLNNIISNILCIKNFNLKNYNKFKDDYNYNKKYFINNNIIINKYKIIKSSYYVLISYEIIYNNINNLYYEISYNENNNLNISTHNKKINNYIILYYKNIILKNSKIEISNSKIKNILKSNIKLFKYKYKYTSIFNYDIQINKLYISDNKIKSKKKVYFYNNIYDNIITHKLYNFSNNFYIYKNYKIFYYKLKYYSSPYSKSEKLIFIKNNNYYNQYLLFFKKISILNSKIKYIL